MAEERSVSDVFQDILRNLQEMVRSEIRLAKVEIRGEVKQAVSSGVWIAAGGVAATSAWIFLLWTLAYALATRMSMWAATLIVAVVMTAAAAVLVPLAAIGFRASVALVLVGMVGLALTAAGVWWALTHKGLAR